MIAKHGNTGVNIMKIWFKMFKKDGLNIRDSMMIEIYQFSSVKYRIIKVLI